MSETTHRNEVRISVTIERPVDAVWSILGGYDWLPRWLDVIVSSTLSEGGRLRHLKTADGAVIVERLLTFDESARRYTYALLEGPSPVIEYVGTMAAEDDGKGGTLATWSSTFVVQGAEEAQVVARFQSLYAAGLQGLKRVVEAQA